MNRARFASRSVKLEVLTVITDVTNPFARLYVARGSWLFLAQLEFRFLSREKLRVLLEKTPFASLFDERL
jgi:hypothetical protein